jgi:hypothetical protein
MKANKLEIGKTYKSVNGNGMTTYTFEFAKKRCYVFCQKENDDYVQMLKLYAEDVALLIEVS